MPIYTLNCTKCHETFSQLMSLSEGNKIDTVECKYCKETGHLEKKIHAVPGYVR